MKTIMARAWELYKNAGCTTRYEFSVALKTAWAESRQPTLPAVMTFIVNRSTITLNTNTGEFSGNTYKAKEWINENFEAAWNPTKKVWTVTVESIVSELTESKIANYYRIYLVTPAVKETSAPVVKNNDGWCNLCQSWCYGDCQSHRHYA